MDAFDLFDVLVGTRRGFEVQAVDLAIRYLALIDHAILVVGFFFSIFVVEFFVFVLEQRFANVAVDLIPVQHPMSRSFK